MFPLERRLDGPLSLSREKLFPQFFMSDVFRKPKPSRGLETKGVQFQICLFLVSLEVTGATCVSSDTLCQGPDSDMLAKWVCFECCLVKFNGNKFEPNPYNVIGLNLSDLQFRKGGGGIPDEQIKQGEISFVCSVIFRSTEALVEPNFRSVFRQSVVSHIFLENWFNPGSSNLANSVSNK